MSEEYKTLQIAKDVYVLVNKNGSIINPVTMKELKHQKDRYGYCHVHLHNKFFNKAPTVHRIVAKAFIPNPDNKPQVNHINGDKGDNRMENLEWCTQSENLKHAYKTGLKYASGGETPRQIRCIETGEVFSSTYAVARRFGIKSNANLYWALSSKDHMAWGYHWEYYEKEDKCDNRDAAKILQTELDKIDKRSEGGTKMSEYRVMHDDGCYQIQKKYYGKWETIGEFDDVESARKMVNDLRKGSLCD